MNDKYLKLTLVVIWDLKSPSVEIHRRGLSKRLSDGKSTEVTYRRLLPSQQLQCDEAVTIELSQVLAADAVRRLTQEEELDLKPERLLRMRWVLTWKYSGGGDRKAAARLVILGYQHSDLQVYRQQHLERCLVICYCKHAPWTNFGSLLVTFPQLSCKHLPLKSIKC